MSEFIVWDKHHENFTTDLTISGITVNEALKENDDWACFQYIGKTDINNKKIYTDSSIIEFDFKGFDETKTVTYTGVVKWSKALYCYEIDVFSHGDKNGDNYVFGLGHCLPRISRIKIIGTLQQDKQVDDDLLKNETSRNRATNEVETPSVIIEKCEDCLYHPKSNEDYPEECVMCSLFYSSSWEKK